jgi:hypothetical protein
MRFLSDNGAWDHAMRFSHVISRRIQDNHNWESSSSSAVTTARETDKTSIDTRRPSDMSFTGDVDVAGETSSSFARVLAKYKVPGVSREDLLQDRAGPAWEWSNLLQER